MKLTFKIVLKLKAIFLNYNLKQTTWTSMAHVDNF